jgi:tetratricopeptide (TPR) repeat protein
MPTRIWMHVHFYTTKDDHYLPIAPRVEHRIGVYPEGRQMVLLAWLRKQKDEKSRAEADRLAGQLTQRWLKEAESRTGVGRLRAAIGAYREALRVAPSSPATIRQRLQEVITRQTKLDDLVLAVGNANRQRPEEAIALLKKILETTPGSAFAHGQLGTIYATMGEREKSIHHLQEVVKCDPNDSYGVTMLAWRAYQDGRAEEAVALCARAHKIDPGHAMNHQVWGLSLAKLERWAEAEDQFRKALASNPRHDGANRGLSEVLRQRGQAVEAIRFARRAVRWSGPDNVEALLTLADAYAAAKRLGNALGALDRALTAAEKSNPGLVPAIRDRQRKWQ